MVCGRCHFAPMHVCIAHQILRSTHLWVAGQTPAESAGLACSVASLGEAPVLHVVEARGPDWRAIKLETVEDDAAMPPAHLVHQPTSGELLMGVAL